MLFLIIVYLKLLFKTIPQDVRYKARNKLEATNIWDLEHVETSTGGDYKK